ncbi:hypothetical protein IFM89_015871 [Coptis chinensis]|uniref:Uncharacterized protein n=1 Tax=Coptis chinensis TaxID=261450 RepID=A0A835IPC6_9MAGN|nr:hypothetical protein IFM89_015871 [Coptis chinensis]
MRAKLKRKALINVEKDSDEIQVEIEISPKKTKPNNMEETYGDIVPSQESQHQVSVRKTTTTKSTPAKRKQRRKTRKRSYKSNRLSRMKRVLEVVLSLWILDVQHPYVLILGAIMRTFASVTSAVLNYLTSNKACTFSHRLVADNLAIISISSFLLQRSSAVTSPLQFLTISLRMNCVPFL